MALVAAAVVAVLVWVAVATVAVLSGDVRNAEPDPLAVPPKITSTSEATRSLSEPTEPPTPTVVEPASQRAASDVFEAPNSVAPPPSSSMIDFSSFVEPALTDPVGDAQTTRVREVTVVLGPGEEGVLIAVENGSRPVATSGRGVAVRTETVLEMLTNQEFVAIDRPATCEDGCEVTFWVTAGGGFQEGHPDAVLMVYASEAITSSSTQIDSLPSLRRPDDTCPMRLAAEDPRVAIDIAGQVPAASAQLGEVGGLRQRSITAMVGDGDGGGSITVAVWNSGKPIERNSRGIAVRTRQTTRLFDDEAPVIFERPDDCAAGSTYEFWVTIAPQFAAVYPAAELRIYAADDTVFTIEELDRLPAYASR